MARAHREDLDTCRSGFMFGIKLGWSMLLLYMSTIDGSPVLFFWATDDLLVVSTSKTVYLKISGHKRCGLENAGQRTCTLLFWHLYLSIQEWHLNWGSPLCQGNCCLCPFDKDWATCLKSVWSRALHPIAHCWQWVQGCACQRWETFQFAWFDCRWLNRNTVSSTALSSVISCTLDCGHNRIWCQVCLLASLTFNLFPAKPTSRLSRMLFSLLAKIPSIASSIAARPRLSLLISVNLKSHINDKVSSVCSDFTITKSVAAVIEKQVATSHELDNHNLIILSVVMPAVAMLIVCSAMPSAPASVDIIWWVCKKRVTTLPYSMTQSELYDATEISEFIKWLHVLMADVGLPSLHCDACWKR